MAEQGRLAEVRAKWLAITHPPPPDLRHFVPPKTEAEVIIDAGQWAYGPSDLLSVIGRSSSAPSSGACD